MSLVLALMCLVGCGGGDAPAADGENTLNFPTEAVNCIVPYTPASKPERCWKIQ